MVVCKLIINVIYYKKYKKFYFILENKTNNEILNLTVRKKSYWYSIYDSINTYFLYKATYIKIALNIVIIKINGMYYSYYMLKSELANDLQTILEKIFSLYNKESVIFYHDFSVTFLLKLIQTTNGWLNAYYYYIKNSFILETFIISSVAISFFVYKTYFYTQTCVNIINLKVNKWITVFIASFFKIPDDSWTTVDSSTLTNVATNTVTDAATNEATNTAPISNIPRMSTSSIVDYSKYEETQNVVTDALKNVYTNGKNSFFSKKTAKASSTDAKDGLSTDAKDGLSTAAKESSTLAKDTGAGPSTAATASSTFTYTKKPSNTKPASEAGDGSEDSYKLSGL